MILQGQAEPWQIVLNLVFYAFIFLSIFYGQKIQYFTYSRQLEGALIKFKDMREETKSLVKNRIIELRKRNAKNKEQSEIGTKELDEFLDEFFQFAMIEPVSLDPAGIIPKIDHLLDVRESRWEDAVRMLVPGIAPREGHNLENLIEAAMAVDSVYRVVRHFFIQGKKSGSLILVMQIAMQIKIIQQMAEAYVKAAKAFYYGQPIGDALGPQVAATFVRAIQPAGVDAKEICKETIVQKVEYKNRTVHVIRAMGPGGTVGRPGEGIKLLVQQLDGKIDRIFMVDAAMKLEGDKSGSIVEGVGAAIGGIGNEKFKIEAASTDNNIPVDAYLCKQNLVDAITTMKKSISMSVKAIVERIKIAIEKRTSEGATVILAGIGNTIGIGI
ncbi:MAG: DUF1512 family protein [Candidatus Lokiarchaeota archaeon]|nr:DUF1512 family protein [Candidatus Lokiarchaeota archaeon]